MKKSFILIALITVLTAGLFISCNVDGDNGLYFSAATSIAPSGIRIKAYMGKDASGNYLFLSDNGIYKNKDVYAKTKELHIDGCFYDSNNQIFYFINTDGKVYKTNGTSDPVDAGFGDDWHGLSSSGYLYKDSGFKYIPNESDTQEVTVSFPMFSGNSMLIMDMTNKQAKIYSAGSLVSGLTVSGFDSDKHASGFIEITAGSKYIVFYGDAAYLVDSSHTSIVNGNRVAYNLGTAQNGGYVGSMYTENKILVKTSSAFYIIKYNSTGSDSKDYVSSSSFSGLKSSHIITMDQTADNELTLITYENGIRVANMSNMTVSDDVLL